MAAARKPTQSQSDDTTPVAPRPLSLLAQEEFGDHYHGDVEQPPKTPPEAPPQPDDAPEPSIPDVPDEDVEEGQENKQVEGDDVEAAPTPEAAEAAAEPIATVRELVEYLEADPGWFDELKVDVTVNGNPSQVPLKDVIASYRMDLAADERLEQAKSKSQQAQQEIENQRAATELEYNKAAQLTLMQEQQLNAEIAAINWDQLHREDPALWSAERVRLGERQAQIKQAKDSVASNYMQHRQQQHQEEESRRVAIEQEQSQLLRQAMPKVSPDWGDPQKEATAKGRLVTYLVGQGISHAEIEKTLNHSAFIIAEKARLWDEFQGKVAITKKRIQTVPKIMKPGARKEPGAVNLEKVRNARKMLSQSGKMDDAWNLLRAEKNRR